MKMPEWTGKAVWGGIVGAVAITVLGFTWGGWTTGGSAAAMAKSESQKAVVAALTPICVAQAQIDPEREVKMAALNEASSYKQRDVLSDFGWATMPGHDKPERLVTAACAAELIKTMGG